MTSVLDTIQRVIPSKTQALEMIEFCASIDNYQFDVTDSAENHSVLIERVYEALKDDFYRKVAFNDQPLKKITKEQLHLYGTHVTDVNVCCTICLDTCTTNAFKPSCDGKQCIFCSDCIFRWVQESASCPHCRKTLKKKN